MATWTRDTRWRQGSLISAEDLRNLGILADGDDAPGLVISHDCDVANDKLDVEPLVEVLPLTPLDRVDNSCTLGRNPRLLHFTVVRDDGSEAHFEALAPEKRTVAKSELAGYEPLGEYELPPKERDCLQRWLASRYRRHAFPDQLMGRMRPLLDYLRRAAKSHSHSIVGFWVSYEPEEEIEPSEPYEMSVYVVYTVDDANAVDDAEKIADGVKKKLANMDGGKEGKHAIYLNGCHVISEEAFTLRDMRRTIELNFDYLSFRGEVAGPMAP